MNFSICRIASRVVAFAAVVTVLAAKPSPVAAASAGANAGARFPVAQGTVKYRMTVNGGTISRPVAMKNNITLTWINYGAHFRQDSQTNTKFNTRAMTMNSWSLYDGKSLYNSSSGEMMRHKIALRTELPPDYFRRITVGSTAAGRLVGHSTILGKVCEIRVLNLNNPRYTGQAKIWMWQKLPLRSEMTMNIKAKGAAQNMKMSMVATQLNTNVKPSPSLFRLPAGYKVQEMGDFQKQMQARMQQRYRQH